MPMQPWGKFLHSMNAPIPVQPLRERVWPCYDPCPHILQAQVRYSFAHLHCADTSME